MTEHLLRPDEKTLDRDLRNDAQIEFIGVIHTPFKTRDDCPRQGRHDGPDCVIEINPEWAEALTGIDGFPYLDVLYWLHESRRDLIHQNRKSDRGPRGTFSLRSPVRPNPIGLSKVVLVKRDGPRLIVRGLDCLDGTPLVDIKPDKCLRSPQADPHD